MTTCPSPWRRGRIADRLAGSTLKLMVSVRTSFSVPGNLKLTFADSTSPFDLGGHGVRLDTISDLALSTSTTVHKRRSVWLKFPRRPRGT